MKKNILITILVMANLVSLICLGRIAWLNMLWKNGAQINSKFAAKMWAENYFSKGKIVKLRLKIEDEPTGFFSKPIEFDGHYVVREHIGYTDPFPILGGEISPSIEVAEIMVRAFNEEMKEMYEDPKAYKKRRDQEIKYWQEHVLEDNGKSKKPDTGGGL